MITGGVGCATTWRTPSRAGCRCPCRAADATRAPRRRRPPRCRIASAAKPACRPRGSARAAAARARACPNRTRPPPQSCRSNEHSRLLPTDARDSTRTHLALTPLAIFLAWSPTQCSLLPWHLCTLTLLNLNYLIRNWISIEGASSFCQSV